MRFTNFRRRSREIAFLICCGTGDGFGLGVFFMLISLNEPPLGVDVAVVGVGAAAGVAGGDEDVAAAVVYRTRLLTIIDLLIV